MNEAEQSLLHEMPDWRSWPTAEAWLSGILKRADAEVLPGNVADFVGISGSDLRVPAGPFGRYAEPPWRQFVAGLFAADWLSYREPVDRVNFERLAFVAHTFPAGFRLYLARLRTGEVFPVGYSAWHPVAASSFRRLRDEAETLTDRTIIPLPNPETRPFLYLFNYSITPTLRGTGYSKQLVKEYASEVNRVQAAGLVAITVSADGIKVAERFGMQHKGTLVVEGVEEFVYAIGDETKGV